MQGRRPVEAASGAEAQDGPRLNALQRFLLRHQPIAAPVIMIALLALFTVGVQALDDHHAPTLR